MDNTNQKTTEIVQNCAEFEPTAQMTRWFTKSVELKTTNVSKIADSLGLHRNTFYNWLRTPGFRDWWLGMVASYFHTIYLQLIGIGLRKSDEDYRYWHDLMEHVSSRVEFPDASKQQSYVEVMATAFFKSSRERGIDLTVNDQKIDNTKS